MECKLQNKIRKDCWKRREENAPASRHLAQFARPMENIRKNSAAAYTKQAAKQNLGGLLEKVETEKVEKSREKAKRTKTVCFLEGKRAAHLSVCGFYADSQNFELVPPGCSKNAM